MSTGGPRQGAPPVATVGWEVLRRPGDATRRVTPLQVGVAGAALLVVAFTTRAAFPDAVRTVSLETRDVVRTLVLVGRVRPPSRAGLGASVAGTVREVSVREGDRVAVDTWVKWLDATAWQVKLGAGRPGWPESPWPMVPRLTDTP